MKKAADMIPSRYIKRSNHVWGIVPHEAMYFVSNLINVEFFGHRFENWFSSVTYVEWETTQYYHFLFKVHVQEM